MAAEFNNVDCVKALFDVKPAIENSLPKPSAFTAHPVHPDPHALIMALEPSNLKCISVQVDENPVIETWHTGSRSKPLAFAANPADSDPRIDHQSNV